MNDRKNSLYIRSLTIILALFIIIIVSISFFNATPKGHISAGLITLIALLMIIVFSESFDQFNIGKLLHMSREIKTKKESIKSLKHENTELRRELVQVISSVSQHQSNTNYIAYPEDLRRSMAVQKASEDEIDKKEHEENDCEINKLTRKRIQPQKLKTVVFKNFLESKSLSKFDLIREAKLVTQFSGIDAVSNIQPIYDGYINTGDSEVFIEVQNMRTQTIITRERIYMMLNKIFLYNKIKKANAHLNLLLVNVDGDELDPVKNQKSMDKLKEFFEPAIVRGLLRIIPLELNDAEQLEVYANESNV